MALLLLAAAGVLGGCGNLPHNWCVACDACLPDCGSLARSSDADIIEIPASGDTPSRTDYVVGDKFQWYNASDETVYLTFDEPSLFNVVYELCPGHYSPVHEIKGVGLWSYSVSNADSGGDPPSIGSGP